MSTGPESVCFFCESRPADPERATTVVAQRRTTLPEGELIESREVEVPRCPVCEQTELLRWVITAGILVAVFGVGLLTWRQPQVLFGVSVAVVVIGGLAVYSAWWRRRGIKRSMGDVREYPAVTELIRDGYRVAKSGPWETLARILGTR